MKPSYRRLQRITRLLLLKVVRVDGKLHVIRGWHYDHGAETEPLADALVRGIRVDGIRDSMSLYDALVEAGWIPPEHRQQFLAAMRHREDVARVRALETHR